MAEQTYLFGYQGNRYTLAQMNGFQTWNKVHPELRRRLVALMDAARAAGYDLGVGSGWRSNEQQEALFYARTVEVACSKPHRYSYKGKCYNLKSGVAPTAPPGYSYHESTDPMGYALAVDMLNINPAIDWANANDRAFGVNDFESVNNEQWHYQPLEIPTARRNYNPNMHTLRYWPIPGVQPACTVSRILKVGATGNDVKCLQTALKTHPVHAQPAVIVDGSFGKQTETAVKNYQGVMGLTVDGMAGPKTLTSLKIWKAP